MAGDDDRDWVGAVGQTHGAHGGGDALLLDQLFGANPPPDPFECAASHIDGAASLLVGISANESLRTGLPVRCDDLLALPAM